MVTSGYMDGLTRERSKWEEFFPHWEVRVSSARIEETTAERPLINVPQGPASCDSSEKTLALVASSV